MMLSLWLLLLLPPPLLLVPWLWSLLLLTSILRFGREGHHDSVLRGHRVLLASLNVIATIGKGTPGPFDRTLLSLAALMLLHPTAWKRIVDAVSGVYLVERGGSGRHGQNKQTMTAARSCDDEAEAGGKCRAVE